MTGVIEGRTFQVLVSRKAGVETSLEKLAKRGVRKGLPPFTWTWGKAYTQKELVPHPEFGWNVECYAQVSRAPLTLVGEDAHYAGWTFVAALQHLEGENITRAVPGTILPVEYRTRGSACEHCNFSRRRNDTYVLRHDDGRMIQVGSTCLEDFLGSKDVARLAAQATILAAARGLAEDGCSGFGGPSAEIILGEYLSNVAWCVREQGWTSRTAAREEEGKSATADRALTYLSDKRIAREVKCEPTAEDIELAAAAELWAETLSDETIDAEKGDYLHNLRAVARTGLVTFKTGGIAASMIVAYQRFLGREQARADRAARPKLNVHLGTVKVRETWTVTLDFVTGYETDFGYTTVLKFRTDDGASLVWKATSTELTRADVGKRFAVKGTVKKHDEYKGEKQTLLSRCAITPIENGDSQ